MEEREGVKISLQCHIHAKVNSVFVPMSIIQEKISNGYFYLSASNHN